MKVVTLERQIERFAKGQLPQRDLERFIRSSYLAKALAVSRETGDIAPLRALKALPSA